MSDLVASRSPYVDGAFVTGDAGTFAIIDPATEEPVAEVEASSVAQVDAAIAAARGAPTTVRGRAATSEERATVMYRFADALAARKDVLLETVIAEAGAPRGFAEMVQIGWGSAVGATSSTSPARSPTGSTTRCRCASTWRATRSGCRSGSTSRSVWSSAITPSNFPLTTNLWKVVPALMTGCSVVLRPSPQTPLEATSSARPPTRPGCRPACSTSWSSRARPAPSACRPIPTSTS